MSDGKLVLTLEVMDKGMFLVQSPLDPEIVASANTLREACEKAYELRRSLIAGRRACAQRSRLKAPG